MSSVAPVGTPDRRPVDTVGEDDRLRVLSVALEFGHRDLDLGVEPLITDDAHAHLSSRERVRQRIREQLPEQIEMLEEHHPDLLEELREVVCEKTDERD